MLPRNHNPNTTVHSTKASHSKLQRIQDVSARESGTIFFKKKEKSTLHPKELQIMEFK